MSASSKDIINDCLKKMFIVVRIGIEDKEFTEDEINQYIGMSAQAMQKRVMEMSPETFMLFCVKDMVDSLMELSAMKGFERSDDDAEDSTWTLTVMVSGTSRNVLFRRSLNA